jgi:hypothetical protein
MPARSAVLREALTVGPARGPPLRHRRDRLAGGAVGAEQAQLEPVGAPHLGALTVSNLLARSWRAGSIRKPTASLPDCLALLTAKAGCIGPGEDNPNPTVTLIQSPRSR